MLPIKSNVKPTSQLSQETITGVFLYLVKTLGSTRFIFFPRGTQLTRRGRDGPDRGGGVRIP